MSDRARDVVDPDARSSRRSRWVRVLAVAAVLLFRPQTAAALPAATSPATAVQSDQANTTTVYVSVTGRSFGPASAARRSCG